jgi:hypothetical protein
MDFKIGDEVRISVPAHEEVEGSRAGVTNEDIGIITKIDNTRDRIIVRWLTGRARGNIGWSTIEEHLIFSNPKSNRDAIYLLKR